MLRRRGGAQKMDERAEINGRSREGKCNEDVGYGSQKGRGVMDIHPDEIVMTSLGKLKVIV